MAGAAVGVVEPAGLVWAEPGCWVTVFVVPAPGAAVVPHAASQQQASAPTAAGQVREDRRAGARREEPPARAPLRGAGLSGRAIVSSFASSAPEAIRICS